MKWQRCGWCPQERYDEPCVCDGNGGGGGARVGWQAGQVAKVSGSILVSVSSVWSGVVPSPLGRPRARFCKRLRAHLRTCALYSCEPLRESPPPRDPPRDPPPCYPPPGPPPRDPPRDPSPGPPPPPPGEGVGKGLPYRKRNFIYIYIYKLYIYIYIYLHWRGNVASPGTQRTRGTWTTEAQQTRGT